VARKRKRKNLKNVLVVQRRGKYYAVVLKIDKRGRARKVGRVKL